MNKTRMLTAAAVLAATLAFYALIGFFLFPALIKTQLSTHVEQRLKHKLALGEVRFNPFTFGLEVNDFNLQEANGGALLSFKRLYLNFEAISVFQRAWEFAEVSLEAPRIYGELRTDGSNNFTALLAVLSDRRAQREAPPPIKVQWIRLTEGHVDLVDLQAGKSARLRVAPIALELTALSTLPGEKGPYKLTARTADGETLTWEGSLSLHPITSTGTLVLADWKLATWARMLGTRIAIEEPAGKLQASMQYVAGYAEGKSSLDVQDLDVRLSQFSIVPKGASVPIASGDYLGLLNLTFGLDARALSIQRAEWSKGRLAVEIDQGGRANWATLYPGAVAATASGEPVAKPPADASNKEATVDPPGAVPPWRVKVQEVAIGDLALKVSDHRARTEAEWQRADIHLALGAELSAATSMLAIDGLKTAIAGIAIDLAGDRFTADQLEITMPSAKASAPSNGAVEFRVDAPVASVAGLATLRSGNEAKAEKLGLRVGSVSAALPHGDSGMRVEITDATMDTAVIGVRPAASKTSTLDLRALELGAKSIVLSSGGEALDTIVEAMSGSMSGLTARGSAQGAELLRLERAQMSGGVLNTRERRIHLERMQVQNVDAAAMIDAAGQLDWNAFVTGFAGLPVSLSVAAAAPAWKAVVKNFEMQNLAASFTDQRHTPPVALAITNVVARGSNIGTDPTAHAQVALTGRLKEGGELAVNGRVNPHTLETDLKVKLVDCSVPSMPPVPVRNARLQVASAIVSAEGRVRHGLRKSAGADLVFEGDLDLKRISIDETEPRQPFLTVDAVHGSKVRVAISPNRLEIPELRVDGFNSKLVIAENQSAEGLGKLLRLHGGAAAQPVTPPASKQPAEATNDEVPVSIARIRIDRSRLEFADLSLRPQFGARMHDLKGIVAGVSTTGNSPAQVDLEARVDEFGSARIRGEINVLNARAYTAIDMDFRNIEMTSLTPYATKFAGYRIASGKMSTDLRYRIKDGMLVGENKLVLDKLELGERVESPTALNIPLELAIAILKDSDGRIDIGLPVSGSLDDPEFSYGALVWKAIGNLLTRIITAPFRALAGLFGGSSSDKLEAIEFDPGRDDLLPPERQKLRTVADALAKRPQLKLTVKPAYAENLDRTALQSLAVRREVAMRSGIKLAPGEDPGPVDYWNPRTQRVIEALFIDRNSAAVARDVRAQQKATTTASGSGTKAADPAAALADVAKAMTQQLFDAHPVPDTELTALAKRRGDAIAAALNEGSKLDSNRLDSANPGAVAGGTERSVATTLELSIVK